MDRPPRCALQWTSLRASKPRLTYLHLRPHSLGLLHLSFRLSSEELEAKFVKESTSAGFDGLKGHRSVGGMRASIYNAFPEAGIDALVDFMREFERKNG